MDRETFLNQVDLEAPFQADLELEADEFESNNNVQNDSKPEKVHSIAETLLYLSNIGAHLIYLSEIIEAFDSLKNWREYLSKKHKRTSIQINRCILLNFFL